MRGKERQTTHLERGKWFAPPSGGYSGLGPNREVIERKGLPPKTPATESGMKTQAQRRSMGTPS
ncbi:hypothetical protein [Pengzhenrongella sicca]|uniref:Uncharacterized protein n=1 Tax=Pengzhenrongella sicca TaxID=2819238 RepID=A0A8A4Z9J8_9MICO|nr:hypothetical protein [Pengzhenrongella sicca]QTE28562.1 hypothetical protein J4E96_14480 [Pengzhenrongella sicca]